MMMMTMPMTMLMTMMMTMMIAECVCLACIYYAFVCVGVMTPFSPDVHNAKLSLVLAAPHFSKFVQAHCASGVAYGGTCQRHCSIRRKALPEVGVVAPRFEPVVHEQVVAQSHLVFREDLQVLDELREIANHLVLLGDVQEA